MRSAHGDHENSFTVLWDVGVFSGVQDTGVRVAEPVPSALDFGLDAFERAALVVRLQVLDVLE
jgi:hypothetical protein